MMAALWIALGIALLAAVIYLSACGVYLILAWVQSHKEGR